MTLSASRFITLDGQRKFNVLRAGWTGNCPYIGRRSKSELFLILIFASSFSGIEYQQPDQNNVQY
ncbi:hypothetical protein [Methylomonas fluvii]|uniref:Uncharacterized protein n=1 Tax=Methylomonas fluvii TaxID=1854564 RepID=A0ABR9DA59_9GAMM|nr:hypothetical protein [Methylomonas fluvii]MBD9359109.1 hypothetical protein [Methylomonas fluvii]